VILVTLGTHLRPMDRLMTAIQDLIADGSIDQPVIVQAAAYGIRPLGAELHGLVPADRLWGWANEAAIIVTHGGPASITLAMSVGRTPVVVPRDPARHEHVDDHQIRFTRWLATRRPIITVGDPVAELAGALHRAAAAGMSPIRPAGLENAVSRLRLIIDSDQ